MKNRILGFILLHTEINYDMIHKKSTLGIEIYIFYGF